MTEWVWGLLVESVSCHTTTAVPTFRFVPAFTLVYKKAHLGTRTTPIVAVAVVVAVNIIVDVDIVAAVMFITQSLRDHGGGLGGYHVPLIEQLSNAALVAC